MYCHSDLFRKAPISQFTNEILKLRKRVTRTFSFVLCVGSNWVNSQLSCAVKIPRKGGVPAGIEKSYEFCPICFIRDLVVKVAQRAKRHSKYG